MFASSSGGPTGAGWCLFGVWSGSSETLAYPVSPEGKAVPLAASTRGQKSAKGNQESDILARLKSCPDAICRKGNTLCVDDSSVAPWCAQATSLPYCCHRERPRTRRPLGGSGGHL